MELVAVQIRSTLAPIPREKKLAAWRNPALEQKEEELE
jgi:hypothetical protein